MTTISPDTTTPLVRAPNQPAVTGTDSLGYLNYFVGTWNSPRGAAATGYNVMPLPQVNAPKGYILKNFPYFEEITFAPIAGSAPNRSGNFTQNSGVLFYEQRVFFAVNPEPPPAAQVQDTLVHAENGTWIYHNIVAQQQGPYGPGTVPAPMPLPVQPAGQAYNKQISVPHGNSLLLVGQGTPIATPGTPTFPVLPPLRPFDDPTVIHPATYLVNQLEGLARSRITVNHHIRLDLSSHVGGGGINNISFEQANANVTWFETSWYIEFLSNNTIQLQYVQSMMMTMMIAGQPTQFLHVDANTLLPAPA